MTLRICRNYKLHEITWKINKIIFLLLAACVTSNGSRCFIKGLWLLTLSKLSSTYGNVAIYRYSLGEVTISSMAEMQDGHYGSTASYLTENVLALLSVPFTAQMTEWIYKTPQRKPVSSWHEITCLHRKKDASENTPLSFLCCPRSCKPL